MSAVAQDKPHAVDLTPDLEIAIRRRLESGADINRAGQAFAQPAPRFF
jgi:hypothetical protein